MTTTPELKPEDYQAALDEMRPDENGLYDDTGWVCDYFYTIKSALVRAAQKPIVEAKELAEAIERMKGHYTADKDFEEHIASKNLWDQAHRTPYDRNGLNDLDLLLKSAKAYHDNMWGD